MQLRRRILATALVALLFGAISVRARADEKVRFTTGHTLFHESPSRTNMNVYTPSATLEAKPWEWLDVRGGYSADVVSGASVAVKAGQAYAATHPGADVISTASVKDTRHVARGGFTLRKDEVTLTTGYTYSTENDYKSNAISVSARTEPYDRNTQFEIGYAKNFDRVCDRVQSTTDTFVRYRALEDSKGCFTDDPLRTTRGLDVDAFQGAWSQAWTPTLVTQLVYTMELLNGFQSNPYRSVVLGEGLKSQEHHPENRARHALAARGNLYVRPLKAAFKLGVRGYWDTWNVKSLATELEFEKSLGGAFRVALRGRYYRQSAAIFWSDDYTGGDPPLGPKGTYFTGDRELSPLSSILGGIRAVYTILPEKGRLLGIVQDLKLGGSFDFIAFHYDEYTLAGENIQFARALVGTLSLSAGF